VPIVCRPGPQPAGPPPPPVRRPLSAPGAWRRLAPFVAATSGAFLTTMLPPGVDRPSLVAAAGLLLVAVAAGVRWLPWNRLPATAQAAPPLLVFVVIALLQHGGGGTAAGFAPLAMLPLFWFALYGTRPQLLLALVATGALFVVPLVAIGAPAYLETDWRRAALWLISGGVVCLSVQQLVGRLRQRTRDLAALGRLARSLSTADDPVSQICSAARDVTGATFAVVLEPGPGGTLAARTGTPVLPVPDMRVDWLGDASPVTTAYRTGRRVFVPDLTRHPAGSFPLGRVPSSRAALFEPIRRSGLIAGVLVVGFATSQPTLLERVEHIIEILAAEAAAALDRLELLERLDREARTDPLTGAANRRGWDGELERELSRCRRTGAPLAVALIDLDQFKAFNDAHGHQAGDALLCDVAVALRTQLRGVDLLARWGGEEFAVALPGCDADLAQDVAHRLRRATPGGQTCSVGLTTAVPNDTPDSVLRRADSALYEAKRAGRNRVVAVHPHPELGPIGPGAASAAGRHPTPSRSRRHFDAPEGYGRRS
jgi:diguanylate cyclase (GGDEF)-like protein